MPAQAGHWRTRVQLSVDMLAYVIGSLVGVTVHHSQPVQNQHLAGMTFQNTDLYQLSEYRLIQS
jgi:hypothetical protein